MEVEGERTGEKKRGRGRSEGQRRAGREGDARREEADGLTVPKFSPWYSATALSESKTGRVPLEPATTLFEQERKRSATEARRRDKGKRRETHEAPQGEPPVMVSSLEISDLAYPI